MKKVFLSFPIIFVMAAAGATCPAGYYEVEASDDTYHIAFTDVCNAGFEEYTGTEALISSGESASSDAIGSFSVVCTGTP